MVLKLVHQWMESKKENGMVFELADLLWEIVKV